ncbi:hypothetical protein INR49_023450 [Caranx melampygus]|nr:hypothetical protein INR49_023450 [Caranx melampygus]
MEKPELDVTFSYTERQTLSNVVHPTDPSRQLNVTGEQGYSLGVDGTEIGIREQHHKKCLCSLGG